MARNTTRIGDSGPAVRTLTPGAAGSGLQPPDGRAPGSTSRAAIGADREAFGERPDLKVAHGVPDREEVRQAGWAAVLNKVLVEYDDEVANSYKAVWLAGFDAGERYGYTFGFRNGGGEVSNQLLRPADRGMRNLAQSITGNEVGRPGTALAAITQDQLTIEVAGLMHAYAALKTSEKVRALCDALRSLPGVDIAPLSIEQDA